MWPGLDTLSLAALSTRRQRDACQENCWRGLFVCTTVCVCRNRISTDGGDRIASHRSTDGSAATALSYRINRVRRHRWPDAHQRCVLRCCVVAGVYLCNWIAFLCRHKRWMCRCVWFSTLLWRDSRFKHFKERFKRQLSQLFACLCTHIFHVNMRTSTNLTNQRTVFRKQS